MVSDQSQPPGASGVRHETLDGEFAGQRLDNYLMRTLKGVPRTRIYRIIRKGEVRVNGKRAKADTRLAGGDVIRIPPVRSTAGGGQAFSRLDIEKTIIYEDKLMLIINKPAGIAVHGGSGVSAAVIESLRLERPDEKHLELVHRLDRDTSGCLMIAKRRSRLKALHVALNERNQVTKRYVAVVRGNWPKRRQQVDVPLTRSHLASGERISRVDPDGKACLTRFRSLAVAPGYSLVACEPVTGRTHQIRVHCRHAGNPIVGDPKYGDEAGDTRDAPGRLMLHAVSLAIPALGDVAPIAVSAPPDERFLRFLEEKGLEWPSDISKIWE